MHNAHTAMLAVRGIKPACPSSILLVVDRDTPYTSTLQALEKDTPYTSTLLVAERNTSCIRVPGKQ
jgi:hypothetical protein